MDIRVLQIQTLMYIEILHVNKIGNFLLNKSKFNKKALQLNFHKIWVQEKEEGV